MDEENPVCIADIKSIAGKKLTQNAWNFYTFGADDEKTLSKNCKAFDRLRIKPRLLRGINKVNTACYIQHQKLDIPIFVAPTSTQKLAHPVGEKGTAAAAEVFGSCMAVSTFSTVSYEELSDVAPNALFWMQLYVYKDRNFTVQLIRRAEMAGFKAVAVTIDTPCLGSRSFHERKKLIIPEGIDFANFGGDSGVDSYCMNTMECTLSWKDIDWLRTITKLPIILKGILTKEDALEALKHDVQGIIVSNHGERQLDGVSSTIEALQEVVGAVNGKIEVYLDGGIRRGTDVFKALALGAKAVFIGRPVLYGLAYNGADGVKKVFQILKDEFERAMLLAGCASLADITKDMVVHESYYWKLSNNKL